MNRSLKFLTMGLAMLSASALAAQTPAAPAPSEAEAAFNATQPTIHMQYYRSMDKRGMNVFETPKVAGAAYTGFQLDWGAAFTQQFQALSHSTDATFGGVDSLLPIGNGFNNATANLYMNAQVAPGIRIQLTSYLSARHHNETWVKDGYIQIDESPIDLPLFHNIMKYTTLKIGHFEVNYGDMHFRRSDNGQALFNPFVGNALMDAFTTEIGAEVTVQRNGYFAVLATSNGESRGMVVRPKERSMATMAKIGVDRQLNDDLRVRLTGSYRAQPKATNNILYAGDRAGSRYYMVMEKLGATESANFTSGRVNPGFSEEVNAFVINPFIKYRGLEFFGMYELAKGRTDAEVLADADKREATQLMGELVYRFGPAERFYVGGRWNNVQAELVGIPDADITRTNFGAGWFITPSLMMKVEYVNQTYDGFTGANDTRNGGKFKGLMIEAVTAW